MVHRGFKTRVGQILPDKSIVWLKAMGGVFIVRHCISAMLGETESFFMIVESFLEGPRSMFQPSGNMHVLLSLIHI